MPPPSSLAALSLGPTAQSYRTRGGVSTLTRVYMVHVLEEGVPVSGEPYTIINGNRTIHEGETNVNGTMVFPLRFVRRFELIQDPTQGGPYMYDINNFTSPIMLKVGNHVIDLGFMTETPLTVNLAPVNPVQDIGSTSQIGSLIAVGTLITIILALAFGQWKGKLVPQDEGHKLQHAPSTSK
jgi:hypothetical protein